MRLFLIITSTNLLIEKSISKFYNRTDILTNQKDKGYNSILVIINWLIKIIYYKLIKVKINVLDLIKVILNILL